MPDARPAPDEPTDSARKRGLAGFANDLRKAWGRGPRGWADLCRAVGELALANVVLRRVHPGRLDLLDKGESSAEDALVPAQVLLVDRVSYAVCVMGLRVPWRSDCLVQAVAARRWLARAGIESRIGIGARHAEDGAFMAHAWLKAGDRLVTGGDIAPYGEFLRGNGAKSGTDLGNRA